MREQPANQVFNNIFPSTATATTRTEKKVQYGASMCTYLSIYVELLMKTADGKSDRKEFETKQNQTKRNEQIRNARNNGKGISHRYIIWFMYDWKYARKKMCV